MNARSWVQGAVLALLVCGVGACGVEFRHSFVMFGARAKRGEVRENLRRLCVAQRAAMGDGAAATTYDALLATIASGNRYAYFVAPGGHLRPLSAPDPVATGVQQDMRYVPPVVATHADVPALLLGGLRLGLNGQCPDCAWAMVAIGDIDGDPELDVWSVSTAPRVAPDGSAVDTCVAYLERDELPRSPLRRLRE